MAHALILIHNYRGPEQGFWHCSVDATKPEFSFFMLQANKCYKCVRDIGRY